MKRSDEEIRELIRKEVQKRKDFMSSWQRANRKTLRTYRNKWNKAKRMRSVRIVIGGYYDAKTHTFDITDIRAIKRYKTNQPTK